MRVLGVDPGLTRCGLGVVDGGSGIAVVLVAVDVIRTPATGEISSRLHAVADGIGEWLDLYKPDAVAIERVFAQHNVKSVMGTAQAAGVAMLEAARRGIPVAMHTPSEVKAAVTGSGTANKVQVTTMVTRLLRLEERPNVPDAADALAIAICHAWRGSCPSTDGGGSRRSAQVIASVSGEVIALRGDLAVISVGGVGLSISCTPRTVTSLRLGQSAILHTSLVVREDSLTLFGFLSEDERHVFEILQTATGVGPRVAQSVLATHDPQAVRLAVSTGDVKALTMVSGIGTKGAQRMLVELKDRLSAGFGDSISLPSSDGVTPQETPVVASVREGLLQLGTKPQDADEALRAALREVPATDAATLLRAALRMLAPR